MNLLKDYHFNLDKEVKELTRLISSFYEVPGNIEEIVRKVLVSAMDNEQLLITSHQLHILVEAIQERLKSDGETFDYVMSVLDRTKEIFDVAEKIEKRYLKEGLDLYLMIKTESICQLYPDFENVKAKGETKALKPSTEELSGFIKENFSLVETGEFSWYRKYEAPFSFLPFAFDSEDWDTSVYLILQITLYAYSLRGILLYRSLLERLEEDEVSIGAMLYEELLTEKGIYSR